MSLLPVGSHLSVDFPMCLAPMVGLSHVGLRRLIREYLPDGAHTIWPTEMLNSRKLPNEDFEKRPETLKDASEDLLVPQILGNEELPIRLSVNKLKLWGAVGIDINMGCPVEKALKHNYGVALMGDEDYAAGVVRMVKSSSDLPVSVKFRSVADMDPQLARERLLRFSDKILSAGADWLVLHPRTQEQKRRDRADWSLIRCLKETFRCPTIGNGDVQTWQDVLDLRDQSGCEMVMVGRALAARPWMVWQVGEALGMATPLGYQGRIAPKNPHEEGREYGLSIQRLCVLLLENHKRARISENFTLRQIQFHIKTTHVWLDYGHSYYALSTRCQSVVELIEKTQEFFSAHEILMFPRTELRQ